MVQAMVDMEIMKCLLEDSLSSSDFDNSRDDTESVTDEPVQSEQATPLVAIDAPASSDHAGPKIDISSMVKIPKRPRSRSRPRSEITFRSPLDRGSVTPPVDRYSKRRKVCKETQPSQTLGRRGKTTRDNRKPRGRQSWLRSPRGRDRVVYRRSGPDRQGTSGRHHRLRTDVHQGVSEAIKKLRLPPSMLTGVDGQRLEDAIIPRHHGPCFRVFTPAPPPYFPEVYTDKILTSIVKAGGQNDELINKKVSAKTINEIYKPLMMFVTGRHNQPYWVATRRETMATGGLQVLAAFVEEQLLWAQTATRQGGSFDGKNIDIILDTAVFACTAFIGKLRQLHLPCLLDKHGELAVVKQLSYLVAMGNRLTEACNLLGEVRVNFRCGMLLAFVMTVPGLQLRKNITLKAQRLFQTFLAGYKPGDVMGLLNVMVVEHHSLCRNSECSAATRAAVGSPAFTKGLFFYPVS
ncbi:ORF57 [Retroperitoneal fibromatosis-associated herpesvirus]|uniref:ORF57 n=1 Tax=Retroperitoneal fibromatosis-associated herpesvirus TaxID=111469 RepID=U5NIY3_9GAMA|nr:ORF57 [Retroperitoneal fibromatosis-associated herpesvirus]AGY30739.1 ORF57 [Retroperitoneal fibromatosis-associated herpesvirus]